MAKWVNVPANFWSKVEFSFKELMANHHVVHHIVMMSDSFIVHGPTGIHKIETFLLNQVSYLILHFISLTIPPHSEKFHLNLCETLFRILYKLCHNIVYDHMDFCMLDILGRSRKILVDCFQPANIIM